MALYLRNAKKRQTAKTVAFLYRWTHIPSGKWYVGSRTAIGCHPDDGYYCTSEIVKPMIESNPTEWSREILVIGEPLFIVELESKYLKAIDAKHDQMSFNKHNGDGKFTGTGKTNTIQKSKKLSLKFSGIKKSDKHRLAISKSLSGKEKTAEHCSSISEAQSIGVYSCDGISMFNSTRSAAKFAGVSQPTIRKWVKNGINGWYFTAKEKI